MQDGNGKAGHEIAEQILLEVVFGKPSKDGHLIQEQVEGLLAVASTRLGELIGQPLPRRPRLAGVGASGRLGGIESLLGVNRTRNQHPVVVGAAGRHLITDGRTLVSQDAEVIQVARQSRRFSIVNQGHRLF